MFRDAREPLKGATRLAYRSEERLSLTNVLPEFIYHTQDEMLLWPPETTIDNHALASGAWRPD
jgi:hypothetical protein